MTSFTYFAKIQAEGRSVVISFYKEQPGGWKLDFKDESGGYIPNGDRWVETLDDLVLQLGNFTEDELMWQEEKTGNQVSFYKVVKRYVIR